MSLVASTEKLNPVALVKVNASRPPVRVAPAKFARIGAGILNPRIESTGVKVPEVKWMVAPVTAVVLKAVKSVKVALPETAAFALVPPKVQVVWPAAFVILAVLVVDTPLLTLVLF